MKIHITAGDCLNAILEKIYPNERFVPFGEAMINGTYQSKLFSPAFIQERAKVHNVSVETYTQKLRGFLDFLQHIHQYDDVTLWFGDEPFCQANTDTVLQTLEEYGYKGKLVLNVVIEETGEIIHSKILS